MLQYGKIFILTLDDTLEGLVHLLRPAPFYLNLDLLDAQMKSVW